MINVNSVYQTVLLILNQQQRGYITPDEFNKIGTQAQLTIFEAYASDLNQQYRLQQNDTEYSNRIKNIEEKLQFFQRTALIPYDGAAANFPLLDFAVIDAPVVIGTTDTLYRLGSVFYKDYDLGQYVQPNELKQLILSPLTQPTDKFPIYTYENNVLKLYPSSIQSGVSIAYLAKPQDVLWNFTTDPTTGAYLYDSGTSIQFNLDVTEQDELIMRILAYAGVIIQDPSIIQTASQAVANQDNNEKQ
tara:strand:- start:18 stop:755 length:738 start_codon:yes stop_codon:yes gene_type:complete